MIDEKKIEEAAQAICFDDKMSYDSYCKIEGFRKGAKWAINEFLKNLWHPASEVPDKDRIYSHILYEIDGGYDLNGFNTKMIPIGENWTSFVENEHINRWLYIYDLFPKGGLSNEHILRKDVPQRYHRK